MEIDFKNINLDKVRDDVNLVLFNNHEFNFNDLKFTNELIKNLKNLKISINESN